MTILAIDLGTSGTKLGGYKDGEFWGYKRVPSVTCNIELNSAVNDFLDEHGILAETIEKIVLTGVNSRHFDPGMPDSELVFVNEFSAIAMGGLTDADIDTAYVISMGTGTAFVKSERDADGKVTSEHIGGTGIGGGFVSGMSDILCQKQDIFDIMEYAAKGSTEKVDLCLADLGGETAGMLYPQITVSNFGKIDEDANGEDYLAGILNATFQVIGMLAVFAGRSDGIRDFVLIGALAELSQAREVFDFFEEIYKLSFIIPDKAEYSVVRGAVYWVL